MAIVALLSVWLLTLTSADGLLCPDGAYYRSSTGDCATQCRCGETAQLYHNTTTRVSYKACVPISSLYYSKAAFNTSLPTLSSVLVGTRGPILIANFLLYVNYDQFEGSEYLNGYSGPSLYSWNTTSWDVEGTSTLFNHSSFTYNPLNLYLALTTGLSIATYSNGNYPLSVQSAHRCLDSAGVLYYGYLATVHLYNSVVPPGNYTIDLNTYFYGDRYQGSSSMQILISVMQVCLRGFKFVAASGSSSHSCVYNCPCGSVEYLGLCSYGTIGLSPLFQEQYMSPSASAGDQVMSVMVTLEDRGLRNAQIQLYLYFDLYAIFFGGDPWTYSYLRPSFSTRPDTQSSVITWQDVKSRADVCSSGDKSYVSFPVDIYLSSRSLFNLGQLFVYFDFAYSSGYARTTVLLNVKADCSQVYDFGSHSCASGCGCGQRMLPSIPFCVPYHSSDLVIFSDDSVTISIPYDQQAVPGHPVTITINPKHTLLLGNSPISLHLEVVYAYSTYLTGIRGGSPAPQVMLAFPGGDSSLMKDIVLAPSTSTSLSSLLLPCARKTDGSLFWQLPFQVAVETQGYFSVLANHTYILSASFSSPDYLDLTKKLQLYNRQIVISLSIQSDGAQGSSFFAKCQRDLIEGQDYLPYVDLRPFHTTTIASGLNSVSDVIYIPNGAPFGSSFQTQAYVASNGLISFERPSTLPSPLLFPTRDVWAQSSYLVAPFWSQSDTRKVGVVSYVTLDQVNSDEASQSLFNNVSFFISNQMAAPFNGSWMLIVTWSDIHPYPHGSYSDDDLANKYYDTFVNRSNTFQAIITTDGAHTYALFTYDCNLMQWSGYWTFATVGYNANGAYFRNHPASGYDVISEAVACQNVFCNVSVSNLVYRLSQAPSYTALQRQLCTSMYLSDLKQLDLSKARFQLEPCPCTWGQAWVDQSRFIWSTNSRLCFVQRFPKQGTTYAQQCCYSDDMGALVTHGAERGTMLRYNPQRYPELYHAFDLSFKEACCGVANMPSLYYARRPTDDCAAYQPPALTWGWGDPHITTLDGRGYTFNGWGEYTLLQSLDNATGLGFTFQGRMVPLNGSNATRHTAFAFGDHETPVVEIGRGVGGHFYVLLNGTDMTSSLEGASGYDGGSVQLSAVTNQSISCFLSSGVGVSVNVSHDVLCFVLSLPARYRGKTLGLLGNYNGNMTDEFVPRGAVVPLPDWISDRTLHWMFAQTWNVTQSESLFTYGGGMSWRDYSHPLHQPAYPDELNYTARQHLVCGRDIFCLYDLYQTENEEFAISTITIDQTTRLGTHVLNHFPPAIRGNTSFVVTVGQPSFYYFVVEDTNDVSVGVVGGVPLDATLVGMRGRYTFTWSPEGVQNVSLVFFAVDSFNLTSFLSVQVQVCACHNGGSCTLDGLVDVASVPSVIMNCVCSRAYDGPLCDRDRDGCAETSCYPGVQCFDILAPGVGVRCGLCPSGYSGDGQNCIGIDECASNGSLCQQLCIDLVGSYMCACFSGFQLEPNGTCIDVDECSGLSRCQHLCSNTIGSYVCDCRPGFLLSEDGHSCNGGSVCSPQNSCSHLCTRVNTSETCFCPPGYVLDTDNRTCTDLNECLLHGVCEQSCNNTAGSFVCGCWKGFKLSVDGRTCEDVHECKEAAVTNTQLCSDTTQCLNLIGGFTCVCIDGFLNISGECFAPPGPLLNCTVTAVAPGGLNMSCTANQLVVFSCTLDDSPLLCRNFPIAVNLTGLGTGYHTITVMAFNTFGTSSQTTLLVLHSEQISFQNNITGSIFQPGPITSLTPLTPASTSPFSPHVIPLSTNLTSDVTLSPLRYSESLSTGMPLSMTRVVSSVVSSSPTMVSSSPPVMSASSPTIEGILITSSQRPELLITSPSTEGTLLLTQGESISSSLTQGIGNSSSTEVTSSSISLSFMTQGLLHVIPSASFQETLIPSSSTQDVTPLLTQPLSLGSSSPSLRSSSPLILSLESSSQLAPSSGSSSLLTPSLGSSSPTLSFLIISQSLEQASTQLSNLPPLFTTLSPSPVLPVMEPTLPSSQGVAKSSVMPQPSSQGVAKSSVMPQPSSQRIVMSSVMPQPSSQGIVMSSVMPQLPHVPTTPSLHLLPNSTPSLSQSTASQTSSLSLFSSPLASSIKTYSWTLLSTPLSSSSISGAALTLSKGTIYGMVPSPLDPSLQIIKPQGSSMLGGSVMARVSPLMAGISPLMTGSTPSTTPTQLQPSQLPGNPNYVAVNDTVIADPLLTLPLYLPDGVPLKAASLCYDLHGKPNTYYNFVSDSCTSVNAHYQRGLPRRPDARIIVVDEIGLRAVDKQGGCVDVAVDINCNVVINGVKLSVPQYTKDGVSVFVYADRVRLSVPNCKHQQLVMWVMCQVYHINDRTTSWTLLNVQTLKFVVARTLSLNENSHGLIAQFWGVPISLAPYRGLYRGRPVTTDDFYVVSVARQRRFVAHWNAVSWDSKEGPCLYAGSGNGGPIFEVVSPNDPVIEGVHTDYVTGSRFATSFKYSRFTGSCT